MAGELAPVLTRSWKEIWLPLSRRRGTPSDLFNELVSELADPPSPPAEPAIPPPEAYNDEGALTDPVFVAARSKYDLDLAAFLVERKAFEIAASGGDGKPYFRELIERASKAEKNAVKFLEECHLALLGFGDQTSSVFVDLSLKFFGHYNVAYEVAGDGFKLYPTMPGVFSRLMNEVRGAAEGNAHTQQMFEEFAQSFRDLRLERTELRLKTCLQKQFNLIEALGRSCPGVTAPTLGGICDQRQWPHATIRDVGKKLYGFRSDYPGLGHAGNPQSVLGPVSLKDFVSISMVLASFTPYFVDQIDAERCYGG